MICLNLAKQQKSSEVLRANVKQILLEETAYSGDDLEINLKIQNGCILWEGLKNSKGYGKVWYPKTKKLILLHRLICFKVTEDIEILNKVVLHSCDIRNCINPDHLSMGTQKQNIRDAVKRGRMSKRGVLSNRTSLTEQDIRDIRRLHSEGVMQKDLALKYKMRPNSISCIISKTNWSHI